MGRSRACVTCLFCLMAAMVCCQAEDRPDIGIFDEDDAIGEGYYDASYATFTKPSFLELGGSGDKLRVTTTPVYKGASSGMLRWRSAPGGAWTVFVARPGFNTADATACANLVLRMNAPAGIDGAHLPCVGLESSPPDVQTGRLPLGDYLPEGIDSNPQTWQEIRIPLRAFPSKAGFSLTRVKDVLFGQNTADNILHTLWFDDVSLVADVSAPVKAVRPVPPANLVTQVGDRSVVLHWDASPTRRIAGYHVYRKSRLGALWGRLTAKPVPIQSYADLEVFNDVPYGYVVRAVNDADEESAASDLAMATPRPFANDDAFLEYVQHTAFDYFWYEANPANGLVRDRSDPVAHASAAATGFGLTAVGIGVDHGWITRAQGAARVLTTLKTFSEKPQGPQITETIGYRGWFYHFLDMETALRCGTTELSSIDTALLLAGMLDCKQFFDRPNPTEARIRTLADEIVNRVDWRWMANSGNALALGWRPESGFIHARWTGYNEGMILYLLGMGAATNPLPADYWETWTSTYSWTTNYGLSYVGFGPLFGHQYSHCWVDFRRSSDAYMRTKNSTYFENSRRAALAQREYCMANPGRFAGYGANLWGLTACDGPGIAPFLPYIARGAPPSENDDGTLAPTAVAGSLPFTPEFALPALRFMYDRYLTNIWTGYGFRDAFNLQAGWWGPHVLGIDQGPILVMIENFRTGRVWDRFMRNCEIQRGLQAGGFSPVAPLRP